jgi:hypothetical protein
MGHGGPWTYGVCAIVETDPNVRLSLLEEGEKQLTRGCVSHNFIQLRELAIDALLEMGDWDGVVTNCERIRAYTADEPLAMCDFVVARGLALARFGRGERSTALQESLLSLQAEGAAAELNTFLPALEAALRRFENDPPGVVLTGRSLRPAPPRGVERSTNGCFRAGQRSLARFRNGVASSQTNRVSTTAGLWGEQCRTKGG